MSTPDVLATAVVGAPRSGVTGLGFLALLRSRLLATGGDPAAIETLGDRLADAHLSMYPTMPVGIARRVAEAEMMLALRSPHVEPVAPAPGSAPPPSRAARRQAILAHTRPIVVQGERERWHDQHERAKAKRRLALDRAADCWRIPVCQRPWRTS